RPLQAYVSFADSSRQALVGCDVNKLPSLRENWLGPTYGQLFSSDFDVVSLDHGQEISASTDGRYHGGRLDLNRIDLGDHLKAVQAKGPLAPLVVLHLAGNGPVATSSIH